MLERQKKFNICIIKKENQENNLDIEKEEKAYINILSDFPEI